MPDGLASQNPDSDLQARDQTKPDHDVVLIIIQ